MCHGRLDFTWIQSFRWFPFCHYSWHCYVPFGTYPHLKLFYFQNLQLPSSFSWLKASLSVPLIRLPMIQCPASPAQPPNCLFHYNWGATSNYCCVRFSALTHMFCSKKKKVCSYNNDYDDDYDYWIQYVLLIFTWSTHQECLTHRHHSKVICLTSDFNIHYFFSNAFWMWNNNTFCFLNIKCHTEFLEERKSNLFSLLLPMWVWSLSKVNREFIKSLFNDFLLLFIVLVVFFEFFSVLQW